MNKMRHSDIFYFSYDFDNVSNLKLYFCAFYELISIHCMSLRENKKKLVTFQIEPYEIFRGAMNLHRTTIFANRRIDLLHVHSNYSQIMRVIFSIVLLQYSIIFVSLMA